MYYFWLGRLHTTFQDSMWELSPRRVRQIGIIMAITSLLSFALFFSLQASGGCAVEGQFLSRPALTRPQTFLEKQTQITHVSRVRDLCFLLRLSLVPFSLFLLHLFVCLARPLASDLFFFFSRFCVDISLTFFLLPTLCPTVKIALLMRNAQVKTGECTVRYAPLTMACPPSVSFSKSEKKPQLKKQESVDYLLPLRQPFMIYFGEF